MTMMTMMLILCAYVCCQWICGFVLFLDVVVYDGVFVVVLITLYRRLPLRSRQHMILQRVQYRDDYQVAVLVALKGLLNGHSL